MRIETYSDQYLEDVTRIVENFYREAVSEYDGGFSPKTLIERIRASSVEDKDNCFLMIKGEHCDGILYGIRYHSLATGKVLFQEVIWYVNKECRKQGIALLRAVENILKSRGVNTMIMVSLANSKADSLAKFYERVGYAVMETHYMRSLDGIR